MARPAIHTTPEAKLHAARTKQLKYYHRILSTLNGAFNLVCQRHPKYLPPPSQRWTIVQPHPHPQLVICLLHHLAAAECNNSTTLARCLEIVQDAKDELIGLAMLPGPYAYVEHILAKYVATIPHECFDIETVDHSNPGIYEKVFLGQDSILDMCGVCDEWRVADEVCQAIRHVIAYLEDVSWNVSQGSTHLAIAHVGQMLKYQKDRHIDMCNVMWYGQKGEQRDDKTTKQTWQYLVRFDAVWVRRLDSTTTRQ
ncbi:uncharacterized protein F5891DRAFT_976335 [Suillus fuscotomentosus]|uniref:Uncharacterized protein n=1 Tax=Suillus fuscotomentosus TaxID=1912939 RepID=A0AAD4HQT3_9AGAM|nr:uncharacterized protein F5891DRAFT_976335 [Suillus fuscotomentosus]KAG1905397.1 hypothetical protein F5891DRAFT_976335 [Suillus fuscotomentosus]